MTTFHAGPLLPLVVADTRGRVVPNADVEVRHESGALATLYVNTTRTLAPTPYRTNADGNFAGYYAEPGYYRIKAGSHPEVTTAAVISPEEIGEIAKMPGTPGPQGATGQDVHGTKRWNGIGPPGTIIGSRPGDEYLDLVTGDLYTLV